MTRTLLAGLALSLLIAAPAHAGKKKKKKDQVESAPPTAAPAETADPGEMSIGRPAGMDFLDLPCPYTTGTEHTWTVKSEREGGTATGTQTLTILEVTPNTFTFELSNDITIDTEDPVSKRMVEAANAWTVKPKVQYFTESMTMNLANTKEIQPLFAALAEELGGMLKEQGAPDAVIANMQQMVSNPAMIEGSVTRDLYPLFNYTCGSFPTTPVDYETQIPSPMGFPLPAKGRITPERPGPDRVHFVNTETVPMEALVPAVMKMMEGAMPEEEVRAALEEMNGEVTITLTVDVHVPTGAITELISEQVVKLPGTEQTTRRTLRAVVPPSE